MCVFNLTDSNPKWFQTHFESNRAGEVKILDFQSQQLKILPNMANAYAFVFTGQEMMRTYFTSLSEMNDGNFSSLPEVAILNDILSMTIEYSNDVIILTEMGLICFGGAVGICHFHNIFKLMNDSSATA